MSRAKRVIRYVAAGGEAAFLCYIHEMKAHLDTTLGPEWKPPPWPRRHTDIRKVTCPNCWAMIKYLAEQGVLRYGRPP